MNVLGFAVAVVRNVSGGDGLRGETAGVPVATELSHVSPSHHASGCICVQPK